MAETISIAFERKQDGPWASIIKHIPSGAAVAIESLARELAAAKELAEIAELMRSILELDDIQRVTPDSLADTLINRSGGIAVGIPDNQSKDNPLGGLLGGIPSSSHQTDRHRYKPNLTIGIGGLASQGNSTPTNIGHPTGGAHGTISHGEDGSTVVTRTEKYSSGTVITSSVTYDKNGNTTRVDSMVRNPDGSTDSSGVVQTEGGGWIEYEVGTDKEGNVTSDEMHEFDVNGDPVKDNDLAGQPGADAGSDSDLVDYLQGWHRSVYGPKQFVIKLPVYVNPGSPESADSNRSGPRLKPEGLNVNPDPNNAFGGGNLSREMARRLQQELRDKAAGGFGPGPKPPKE